MQCRLIKSAVNHWAIRQFSNIVPVFKKDNKEQAENYRPISLLSIVSKVMERCIFNAIRDQFSILSAHVSNAS